MTGGAIRHRKPQQRARNNTQHRQPENPAFSCARIIRHRTQQRPQYRDDNTRGGNGEAPLCAALGFITHNRTRKINPEDKGDNLLLSLGNIKQLVKPIIEDFVDSTVDKISLLIIRHLKIVLK